jgi:hypothetical protein
VTFFWALSAFLVFLKIGVCVKRDMWQALETGEMHTGFWCGDLRERDHFEDPGIDGRIIFRWIFRKWNVGAWTGLIWLRIGVGGWHL